VRFVNTVTVVLARTVTVVNSSAFFFPSVLRSLCSCFPLCDTLLCPSLFLSVFPSPFSVIFRSFYPSFLLCYNLFEIISFTALTFLCLLFLCWCVMSL